MIPLFSEPRTLAYNEAMEQSVQRDWSGCEIIEYDSLKMGGAPTVRGRRITPDAYVDNFNDGFSAQEIANEIFKEPVEDVEAILRYANGRGYLARPFRQ